MSLTPEAAKIIADYTLSDYEQACAATKAVIAAVPASKESYAPSEKCMKSLDLAWHIARTAKRRWRRRQQIANCPTSAFDASF
jgi:hypothetical protein